MNTPSVTAWLYLTDLDPWQPVKLFILKHPIPQLKLYIKFFPCLDQNNSALPFLFECGCLSLSILFDHIIVHQSEKLHYLFYVTLWFISYFKNLDGVDLFSIINIIKQMIHEKLRDLVIFITANGLFCQFL